MQGINRLPEPCATAENMGAGLGLRIPHMQSVLASQPDVNWFEVHICNFLRAPLNRRLLASIAENYPLSFHGVSLNLGGSDELDSGYLKALKLAIDDFQPKLVSEHACFTAYQGQHFHDLLPVPYTREGVHHFVQRIDQVQNYLGRTILIENVSRYCGYLESEMSEAEFLADIASQTGCRILLDLNNIYVNQCNFPHDKHLQLEHYLEHIALQHIGELHLAGHSHQGDYLVDSHDCEVPESVWQLLREFIVHWQQQRQENRTNYLPPCLIEWDNNLPEFSMLQHQGQLAQAFLNQAHASDVAQVSI